ncbi:Mov34/MPN/PAD-1 family protein [Oscillospiraceae bacterium OttesenSCG-928-G22]|nr:Mov34/MPN/PAD-1 family protein [Oscillospiraceae bacterium OttesenSCG-928-G22]
MYIEPKLIVLTTRARAACVSETLSRKKTETGGLFLGHRCGPIWYVIEAVDPGPNSIFEESFFSYDQDYVNHLANKLRWLYVRPLDLLGLWHRHPGSLDRFSSTDKGTNAKFAALNSGGAVSAIVNLDPEFRLTAYHIPASGHEKRISAMWGNGLVPPPLRMLRGQETRWKGLSALISEALSGLPHDSAPPLPAEAPEAILALCDGDTKFLADLTGNVRLSLDGGVLTLSEETGDVSAPLLRFWLDGASPRVQLGGNSYRYEKDLLMRRIVRLYLDKGGKS